MCVFMWVSDLTVVVDVVFGRCLFNWLLFATSTNETFLSWQVDNLGSIDVLEYSLDVEIAVVTCQGRIAVRVDELSVLGENVIECFTYINVN